MRGSRPHACTALPRTFVHAAVALSDCAIGQLARTAPRRTRATSASAAFVVACSSWRRSRQARRRATVSAGDKWVRTWNETRESAVARRSTRARDHGRSSLTGDLPRALRNEQRRTASLPDAAFFVLDEHGALATLRWAVRDMHHLPIVCAVVRGLRPWTCLSRAPHASRGRRCPPAR